MRLAVNGVHLNVEVSGEGQPLVLLHGFTGSNATWAKHRIALEPQCRVIAIEMLGHGLSDAPPDAARYDMAHSAVDIAAVLNELGLEKVALLGYSMGGRIALYFAATYPEKVSRLILESASPGLDSPIEGATRTEADNVLADMIEREGITAFVDRWEAAPLFASQSNLPPEVRARLHRQRLTNRSSGLANSLRGLGTGVQPSLWSRLDSLMVATLLIAGELDTKFCDIARHMHTRLPNCHLEIVAQAGHAVHLEQPNVFERLVVEFLSNGDG